MNAAVQVLATPRTYNKKSSDYIEKIYTDQTVNLESGFSLEKIGNHHAMHGFCNFPIKQSYTLIPSRIVNNAMSIIALNQLLMMWYFNAFEDLQMSDAGKLVATQFNADFKKMIIAGTDVPYTLNIEMHERNIGPKKRTDVYGQLSLDNGAFLLSCKGVILNRDPHA